MRLTEILTITPDLIPVSESIVGDKKIQTVNARVLHTFLEVTSKFADWIKNRINEYGFTENVDFVSLSKNLEKPEGGRPTTEYHLTFDMAKELSMVERNDKGRQARQYFIERERRYKELVNCDLPATNDPILMQLQAIMDVRVQQVKLEKKQNFLEQGHNSLKKELAKIEYYTDPLILSTQSDKIKNTIRRIARMYRIIHEHKGIHLKRTEPVWKVTLMVHKQFKVMDINKLRQSSFNDVMIFLGGIERHYRADMEELGLSADRIK
ncbi:MAG: antA/AntB antirepressor family protein [Candidatus Magnetobacterium sp. LHC-1]|nr:antA/AntB antirepressor family protein [Nitrospirota bacterium]